MDRPSPAIRAALVDFEGRLRRRFASRLRWVRLFGSWARGEAHEDSDVDVAVVIDDLSRNEWREAVALSVDTEEATDVVLSPFVVSVAHFDELVTRERRIAQDILRDGIPP